jgi:hypothetical protein
LAASIKWPFKGWRLPANVERVRRLRDGRELLPLRAFRTGSPALAQAALQTFLVDLGRL